MRDKKTSTQKIYLERVNKVIQYINLHIGENFDLEELASQSNYSSFHFHRIMRAYLGEPLGCYINRVRLDTAANLLSKTSLPVNEIAIKTGYDTPSSFNKAFRKRFNVPPLLFRKSKKINFADPFIIKNFNNMKKLTLQSKIKEIKDIHVVYASAIGVYGDENTCRAWEKIYSFAREEKLFGTKTEFIGINYDNPSITESEKCRYEACLSIEKNIKAEGDIATKTIEGGKYAIFELNGPYELLKEAYDYIFGKWISENNMLPGEKPCFEKYLNSLENTKPEDLKTEIYVPLK